jgi:hypothetical protein
MVSICLSKHLPSMRLSQVWFQVENSHAICRYRTGTPKLLITGIDIFGNKGCCYTGRYITGLLHFLTCVTMQPSAGRHWKLIIISLYDVLLDRVTKSMVDDTSVFLGYKTESSRLTTTEAKNSTNLAATNFFFYLRLWTGTLQDSKKARSINETQACYTLFRDWISNSSYRSRCYLF